MNADRPDLQAACTLCGLPVSAPGVRYCCYGCYLVDGIAAGDDNPSGAATQANWALVRVLLASFLAMGVMVFSIVLYSNHLFPAVPGEAETLGPLAGLLRWLTLAFATPAVLLLGVPLLLASLPTRSQVLAPSAVNALVAVGAISAYVYSVVSVLRGRGDVYLETAVMILVLVTLGRYLESRARVRVGDAVRELAALIPDTARLVQAARMENEEETPEADRAAGSNAGEALVQVEVDDLRRGDVIRVLAGERVPVDGVVRGGAAAIDTSLVTGESEPVLKEVGAAVHAATTCVDGYVDVLTTARSGQRFVDRLTALVRDARYHRPRLERLAERVSYRFLAIVVLVAAGTFGYWSLANGVAEGFLAALAVLLISCPCALGIATPLAVTSAFRQAARSGILVRGGEPFEALARPGTLFLDKTGTLTESVELRRVEPVGGREEPEVVRLARSLTGYSTHPIAQALSAVSLEEDEEDGALALDKVEVQPGLGIVGAAGAIRLLVGNERFIAANGVAVDGHSGPSAEETALYVARDGELLGTLVFCERLRADATPFVRFLQHRGWEVEVLTGDTAARGTAISQALGVKVRAGLLPEDKAKIVAAGREGGQTVAMVGDGINDAPALATASVGIALTAEADITQDASDVIVLKLDNQRPLSAVASLIELSTQAVRRMRWNLAWAFGYNAVGVAGAAAGLIHPLFAAILMIASSLTVVAFSSDRFASHSALAELSETSEDLEAQRLAAQPVDSHVHAC